MPEQPVTFEPPRGMRDFYPADMERRNRLFDTWSRAARLFNFEQYDACVVESLDLLKRKGGEEIVGQIYAFKDKSDRDLALRPEMTPTLARMVAARQGQMAFPLKWFAIAQCFRYERTTRGRKREHYQWNLDVVGEESIGAEAEVLACAITALADLNLNARDFQVHYSSRALLSDLLAQAGIEQSFHPAVFLALDKRGKIPDAEIELLLKQSGLDHAAAQAAMKLSAIGTLEQAAAMAGASSKSAAQLAELRRRMEEYGMGNYMLFDIGVVRGLGYYTGAVFEAFATGAGMRALFGGGRYDRLLRDLGGGEMTAVGLGFGDVVITDLLAEKNAGCRPDDAPATDLAVGFMDDAQRPAAIKLAAAWRAAGRRVDLALRAEKPKRFFGRVGKGNVAEAVFLGPDDLASGAARLKNLRDRSERKLLLIEPLAPRPA